MIYITKSNEGQALRIASTSTAEGSPTILRLHSEINNTTTDIVVEGERIGIYYIVTPAAVKSLTRGEYSYELLAGGELLAQGIAIVVDNNNNNIQYTDDERGKQYAG